jgi:hypothetical protein
VRLNSVGLTFSPSDLVGFVACPHLTTLELAVAREELAKPYRHNAHADLIRRKGEEHEATYLASLGDGVVRIGKPWELGWEVAAAATADAMQAGARVVYQAAFVDGPWRGLADFVELRWRAATRRWTRSSRGARGRGTCSSCASTPTR